MTGSYAERSGCGKTALGPGRNQGKANSRNQGKANRIFYSEIIELPCDATSGPLERPNNSKSKALG